MDKNDPRRQPTEDELDDLNEHWNDPGDPDGIIEAEEERKWQARHPAPVASVPQSYRRKRRWPKVLLIIVLLAAATAGAYWFGNRQASAPAPKTSTTEPKTTPKAQPTTTAATKHYDSVTYTIGFDYPADWKLVDTTTRLTVASPSMQFTTASGKQVSGHVLMTVRNKQAVISEFADGPASAVLDSQKLTYKQPTSIQRAQTYLSFLGFAKSPVGGLDALYITGDSGYLQAQAIPMADVVKGDPLINVTFVSCATDDCSTGTVTPYDVATSVWKSDAVNKPVITMLQSLTLN